MYSKYILSSNWKSLSSNYIFDGQINLNNQFITVDGNMSLSYSPIFNRLNDYANNNYSLFFLTDNININDSITLDLPQLKLNKQVCLLAVNMVNNLVADNTAFLKFEDNILFLDNVVSLNNNSFFELEFISDNEVFLYVERNDTLFFICVDDITLQITSISAKNFNDLTDYQKSKIYFNFLIDKKKNNILFYKTVQYKNYTISYNSDNSIALKQISIENALISEFFTIIKYDDLPASDLSINWLSYTRDVNDSISINRDRSVYNLKNNFLIHNEYNTVKSNSLNVNVLNLKNQVDINDNVYRSKKDNSFRYYKSILTGDNREKGVSNISLSYTSDLYPIKIASDKTTWFHVPYNSYSSLNVNDSNLKINGANPGLAPLFSDRIFKKAANYSKSSNMGDVKDNEQSGVWLCSWLSGGPDNSLWVDRFYNPDTFTILEALKYSTNVDYTPQYKNRYSAGITDTISNLTLESECLYAYTRMGKKTAKKIIEGLSDSVNRDLIYYKNNNKSDKTVFRDEDGDGVYDFNSSSYGSVSLSGTTYNNFSLSFFASRRDWNKFDCFQILGNYIDKGFGLFNDIKITPLIYYTSKNLLKLFNKDLKEILKIDIYDFLENNDQKIAGIFRRDFNSNFHILTDNSQLLEFNSNGTIVDSLSLGNVLGEIESSTNNLNFGYILDKNGKVLEVNLQSNVYREITNELSVISIPDDTSTESFHSLACDNYNNVYYLNGIYPILRNNNLYFLSTNYKSLISYNINNNTKNIYLSSLEEIDSYGFDSNGNTYLLYKDRLSVYDPLGKYLQDIHIKTNIKEVSAINFFINNINESDVLLAQLIDADNKNYIYNFNLSSIKLLDREYNVNYNKDVKKNINRFDFSNYNYNQNIGVSISPTPSYNFKVKIYNQLNYEDSRVLNINVIGDLLKSGEHHFVVSLDTLKGQFSLFLNGELYKRVLFSPKKYSFSNLLGDDIIVGATPFYGNRLYSDFYNSDNNFLFVKDLKIEKIKLFKTSLNSEEARMLYFEKHGPEDTFFELPINNRNYIDTISRTFRHKLQGHKANLINVYINDSIITDKMIQQMYEATIIDELNKTLPAYVKINSITWLNNKDSDEKMLEGSYNTRNTVTEAI